uniref:Uncharacterized protein n=1 Tax=Pseudo-nitzschia australis TaxID=44445 RepID=A0A7S4AQS0_9STRA
MRKRTSVYYRRQLAFGWLLATSSTILLVANLHVEVDALQHAASRNYRVSQEILECLRSSPGPDTTNDNTNINDTTLSRKKLDLETNFYDISTGLHSEGVWHNCMAGIASLQLQHSQHDDQQQHSNNHNNYDHAVRTADSLFRCSWDGTSFRRRIWSGNWDHSRLQLTDADTGTDIVHQANYYKESSEHRCIQHAIALVFWSILAQEERSGSANSNTNTGTNANTDIRFQQSLIANQFVDEFWNGRYWTTISQTQGSGTTLRPSASSGVATKSTSPPDEQPLLETPYVRAVDQAMAVIACLQHLQLLDNDAKKMENIDAAVDADANANERDRIVRLIQTTCNNILDDKEGFGYNNLSSAQTYLGLNRNRNFWHEGWVMLALTLAREYIWPIDTQEGCLKTLWKSLQERYTITNTATAAATTTITGQEDGTGATIWHWAMSEKDIEYNVRYCGDNALAYAIRRNMRFNSKSLTSNDNDDVDVDAAAADDAFWTFIGMLRSENKSDDNECQLASVADVYTQVRLHPNTELAALLVWPS